MTTLPSGLPVAVGDEETLSRCVLVSRYFSEPEPNKWRVKYPAFIPDPHDELSVSRVEGLPDSELETYGRPVADSQGKTLYGVALVKTSIVRSGGLEVQADEGPPRHANIVNWAKSSDPKEQKAARQAVALELAENSRFVPIDS